MERLTAIIIGKLWYVQANNMLPQVVLEVHMWTQLCHRLDFPYNTLTKYLTLSFHKNWS